MYANTNICTHFLGGVRNCIKIGIYTQTKRIYPAVCPFCFIRMVGFDSSLGGIAICRLDVANNECRGCGLILVKACVIIYSTYKNTEALW